jgi:hypothetical protein
MDIKLEDSQVVDIVVREMAEIIDNPLNKEDMKHAATKIIQYYLRAHEYEQFTQSRNI